MEVKQEKELKYIRVDFSSCKLCPYRTTSRFQLIGHLRLHRLRTKSDAFVCHSNTPQNHRCNSCAFETELKVKLQNHINTNHKQLENKTTIEEISKSYTCKNCGVETSSLLVFFRHLHSSKNSGNGCGVYICSLCKYATTNETYFKAHSIVKHWSNWIRRAMFSKLVTSSSAVYKCELCPFHVSNRKYSLVYHIQCKHADPEEITWYKCDQCPYMAVFKSTFDVHMFRKHIKPLQEKWFKCDQCEFRTASKRQLHDHVVSERHAIYTCDQCMFQTYHSYSLKRHRQNMHSQSDNIKWFQCNKCNYKTRDEEKMEIHMSSVHLTCT